jgi:hypothetical protein
MIIPHRPEEIVPTSIRSSMASTFYAVISWVLIVLGAVHMTSTLRIYSALTMPALWFFGGGLLIVIGAMLNLLNRTYGHLA